MPFPSLRAGKIAPALLLLFILLVPLFAQEADEDFFEDELLFMEGEGITVVASPETTQQMRILNKEEIEGFHAPDLASLLQSALGLGITRYGPYGNMADVNIRGFDGERVAFLLDGVPLNSPLSGDADLSAIDLNALERIEVIYGGSDTKYQVSGALGGVVNLITVKPQGQGLRMGGSLSNTSALPGPYYDQDGHEAAPQWQDLGDTQNIALSMALRAGDFSLNAHAFANHAGNHFLYQDSYGVRRRKVHNEVWDTGAALSLMHKLPEYATLMLQGDLYMGDKNIPVSGTASVAGKQKDFSTRQTLMLDAPRAFREDLAAEASLGHIWQTLDYARPGLPASRQDLHSLTAVNRWAWYPVPWLSLRVSGDYRYLTLDSTDMGGHYRHEGGLALSVEYAPGAGLLIIPSIKAAINGAATNGAAINGAAINGAPEAVLIAGALPVVPVPKFGLVWTAGNFSLKNNYFRSFKYPDFEDLYWIGEGTTGNPRLRPEDGWGGDLIAAYFFNRDTNLEDSFFAQWTQDSIHWYNSNGTWQPENVGAAAFFGLDAKFRGKIPLDRGPFTAIGFSLSYQYLLSYLLSYGYTFASDKRIPYMPAHTLGFSADLSWESGALILEGHFESLRYGETANLVRLAPCFLLDLRVNQKIGKTFSVFGALRNALNTSYESLSGYPMPGISLTLGVQINFEKEP